MAPPGAHRMHSFPPITREPEKISRFALDVFTLPYLYGQPPKTPACRYCAGMSSRYVTGTT